MIVRDLGFGGLMHIPPLRVHHQVLRELANNIKLGENRLETGYGSFKITPRKIGHALAINATGDLFPHKVDYKKLSEDDKGKTLKSLTDEMMDIGVSNEEDRLMFKRIFILYIQMTFLLPMTINKISPVHLAPIFEMDSITEQNWGGHVLTFIVKGITDYKEKKKKAIDGCLFALMIIYFHLSKNKGKKRAERPPKPWIANWSKEQLVKRMNAETEEILASSTSSSEEETTDSDSSTSEFETQEDSEDSARKQPSKKGKNERYEISSEDLDELLKKNDENSGAQREKEADMRSTEGHYVSSETIPNVNLGSDDPSSQRYTEQSSVNKPAESTLSLVQESASEPADSNIMVVREETPSEALAIYPAEEDAAALMMTARTASYVPKTDPMPSFSLGFTDSSQGEAATQEGASMQEADRAKTPETVNLLEQLEDLVQKIASSAAKEESKSPQIQKETGGESSGKFETPARINQNTDDMKEKCYIWVTRVKTYADDSTNEFDNLCTLIAQDKYILNRMHLASLQAGTYIESESMAISKHPNGEFISPKTNKEFKVEDYPMGYVISRIRAYTGGAPLKKNELEIKATYEEADHYRVEYASRILFSEMNKDRDQAIRVVSNEITSPKYSKAALLLASAQKASLID
ncbi:hypothetical protein Ahy_B07g086225 [Arachis hypogaea]|uniref:Aminotransferase-like plant mobile domain-containing protein n=1 Tax=Arachis hypogaea TaxID=3818 RepID=A0A444Y9D7_ARAHY|nr:hypothetical protein Ahy_B07g086225 [Arachis hypogaea]